MTTRTDMIELARKRVGLKKMALREAAQRAKVDTSILYLTVREIASERGLSVDQVRSRLKGVEAVRVPGALCSFSYGYHPDAVSSVFDVDTEH